MAKSVLDMILWHPDMDIKLSKITYIHRGAKGNLKTIQGSQIVRLARGFLILDEETQIPYHRITKIKYKDKTIWNK